MTVSLTTVKQVYSGNGSLTAFAIPFSFIQGEESVIKVYLREESRTLAQATDIDTGTDILTAPNNFYSSGDAVVVTSSGTAPTPLVSGTTYYVIYVTATQIKLATTKANAIANTPINITAIGSGTLTLTPTKPYEKVQTLTTHYTLSGGPPVTTVDMVTAPLTGQELIVTRESAQTQDVDYNTNSPWQPLIAEAQYDRLLMLIQELDERLDRALVAARGDGDITDLVLPKPTAGALLSWNEDGTGLENLESLVGPAGADGADGVFSQIASQAEAEAGTDNTKGMTPLRVLQAIDANPHANIATNTADIATNTAAIAAIAVPTLADQAEAEAGIDNVKYMSSLRVKQSINANPHPQIATNTSNISTNTTNISTNATNITQLDSRVTVLEGSLIGAPWLIGKQRCNNNQTAALDLDAALGENGKGLGLTQDDDGAKYARIEIEIYRQDDAEIRASSVNLIIHSIGGTWYMAEEDRTILTGNPDGVTFSFTEAGGVMQVQYTSDNMTGGNYLSDSYIHWRKTELSTL